MNILEKWFGKNKPEKEPIADTWRASIYYYSATRRIGLLCDRSSTEEGPTLEEFKKEMTENVRKQLDGDSKYIEIVYSNNSTVGMLRSELVSYEITFSIVEAEE